MRLLKHQLLTAAAFAVTLSAQPLFAQQVDSATAARQLAAVRTAIDKGNAEWSAGWATRDGARVAAIFDTAGVQLAGSGKVFKGRAVIASRQHAAMLGADSGVKVSITTVNVWLDGNIAYETGKYRYDYFDKGVAAADTGRYVTVWKHQRDGSWKLSMDMGVPQ